MFLRYLVALALIGCQREEPKIFEVMVKDAALPEVKIEIKKAKIDKTNVNENLILSSFSTKYATRGKHKIRAANIAKAVKNLNGVILYPGEEFSFNGAVGRRNKETGFGKAPIYYKGLQTKGMGGGICQVSSTLYAAAMLGHLEITRRSSHSRPSNYISIGMDATVSWSNLDLRFKNNKSVPIEIKSKTQDGEIIISILGIKKDYEVKHYFRFFKSVPFETEYIYDKRVKEPYMKQKGKNGKPGVMIWKYYRNKELFDTVKVKCRYQPVNEFWVTGEISKDPDKLTKEDQINEN